MPSITARSDGLYAAVDDGNDRIVKQLAQFRIEHMCGRDDHGFRRSRRGDSGEQQRGKRRKRLFHKTPFVLGRQS
ncbi:MAG: hypothetical protein QHC65_16150 [Sphingomonas sp.]|nr:hypothetical protein [Sphingomonas sp.]